MHVFKVSSVSNAFLVAIQNILSQGMPVAPRGLKTLELTPVAIDISNPLDRFLWVNGRVLNPAFAVAEAVWIMSGSNDPWIFNFNSKLLNYTDEGVLKGAYGPRIRYWGGGIDQLNYVRKKLLDDSETRQAIIQVWDPQLDTKAHKDIACTLNYRFLIRNGKLHLYSSMRSQDVWLGLPYDLFTITLLQELVAGWVGVGIGHCIHILDSLHLYNKDREGATMLLEHAQSLPKSPSAQVLWKDFSNTITDVREDFTSLPDFWRECGLIMASYKAWKVGNEIKAFELAGECKYWGRLALNQWYNYITFK